MTWNNWIQKEKKEKKITLCLVGAVTLYVDHYTAWPPEEVLPQMMVQPGVDQHSHDSACFWTSADGHFATTWKSCKSVTYVALSQFYLQKMIGCGILQYIKHSDERVLILKLLFLCSIDSAIIFNRKKGQDAHFNLWKHTEWWIMKNILSVSRQKGLSTNHLYIQLDPFALKLTIYMVQYLTRYDSKLSACNQVPKRFLCTYL